MAELNEYAGYISEALYQRTPKEVFAAIAVSFITNHMNIGLNEYDTAIAREWAILHDNGIITQPAPDLAKLTPRRPRTLYIEIVPVATDGKVEPSRWVGPFADSRSAYIALNKAQASPTVKFVFSPSWRPTGADGTEIGIIAIWSRKEAIRRGMREGLNLLGTDIPTTIEELNDAEVVVVGLEVKS